MATSDTPLPVDLKLVQEIHFRWFETSFRVDAGQFRTQMVLNRKGTAVEVEAILPAVQSACDKFIVAEANALSVRVYDVHPFLDGNTRATWHLRNYLLMLDGLRPLVDLADLDRYEGAWWNATAADHLALDDAVVEELTEQDRSD